MWILFFLWSLYFSLLKNSVKRLEQGFDALRHMTSLFQIIYIYQNKNVTTNYCFITIFFNFFVSAIFCVASRVSLIVFKQVQLKFFVFFLVPLSKETRYFWNFLLIHCNCYVFWRYISNFFVSFIIPCQNTLILFIYSFSSFHVWDFQIILELKPTDYNVSLTILQLQLQINLTNFLWHLKVWVACVWQSVPHHVHLSVRFNGKNVVDGMEFIGAW